MVSAILHNHTLWCYHPIMHNHTTCSLAAFEL